MPGIEPAVEFGSGNAAGAEDECAGCLVGPVPSIALDVNS